MHVLLSRSKPAISENPASLRFLADVAIVVPVGPGDDLWRRLLTCLAGLPIQCEIHLVAVESEPLGFAEFVAASRTACTVRWSTARPGRGFQLNAGIERTACRFVWFLHADSMLRVQAVVALDKALKDKPEAIHYFDLRFTTKRLGLMALNSWGVWLRSHCLGLPFGDQGLCMSREIVERLDGFNESVSYGEDHLLVWAAHRNRIPLKAVGATIETSSRKYDKNGWFRTTALHLGRTWSQAFPQWLALLRSRMR